MTRQQMPQRALPHLRHQEIHQVRLRLLLLLYTSLKEVFSSYEGVAKRTKYKGPFSMDHREQGSHARGVYPSSMGTASVK